MNISVANNTMNGTAVTITGTGSYLPNKILTNDELSKMVDTSDEWITTRTGIKERHIAAPDEATSDLGEKAAKEAMKSANVTADDLDMIICASVTPDMPFPSTACFIQKAIGAKKAFCFDIQAACSGFIYALEIARQFVSSCSINTALIVGAEKLSAITDWEDRSTCVLFGDAAGAAVVQRTKTSRGIIASSIYSDGTLHNLLNLPGGGSRNPASIETVKARLHYLKMAGKEVFKYAVNAMLEAATAVIEKAKIKASEIKCVIPHQANMRIIQAISERLDVPLERFYINLPKCGNTSAASIPVALDEAVKKGVIQKNDLVLMVAFGGGFTWGATLLEW